MKQVLFVWVALVLVSTANAATGILDTNKDDGYNTPENYNHSSLTNKFVWTDKDSWTVGTGKNGTGAWQPSTMNDYVIRSGVIRQPTWTPYSFIGRTLQIGEGTDKSATMGLGIRGPACVLNFGQNGKGKVIWQYGQFSNYYGGSCEVNGDIEIRAVPQDNAGKTTRFSCSTNQQVPIDAKNKMGVSFWFNGAFSGEAGTLVQFHIASYVKTNAWGNCGSRASRYCFAGDMTRCSSTLRFRPWSNRDRNVPSQTDYDSKHTTGEIRRSIAVFTPTTKSPMPGTIETWGGSAIELRDDAKFTVANLDLAGNDLIAFTYDFAERKGGTLTVRDNYTHQHFGKTLIRFNSVGVDPKIVALRHPILRAPKGTLDIDDFAFETPPDGFYSLIVEDDADGYSSLCVFHQKVIWLTQSDVYSNVLGHAPSESFRRGEHDYITNHWCDLQWPRPAYDYYVEKRNLRTPTLAIDDDTGGIKTNSYRFMGDRLILAGSAMQIRSTREIQIDDLRMWSSGTTGSSLTHVNSSSGNVDLLPPGYDPKGKAGMCILDGHLTYSMNNGAFLTYTLNVSRGFVQQMEVEGVGPVKYTAGSENSDSTPGAFFWLHRPNPKMYAPRTRLSASVFTWTPTKGDHAGQKIQIPDRDMCCHVYFDSPLCFGGPLKEFSIDGIEICDYSIFEPTQTMSFDDPNKGFRIGKGSTNGVPVAQFVIRDGITMTLHSPINFNADNAALEKSGGGILELGEGCYSTFWSGGNPEPSSGASNNLMKVLAGGLKISSTNACDGLQVSMTDKARIILAAHPDNELLARYGLYNQKYRKGRTDRTEPDPSKEKAIYYGKPLYLEEGAKWLSFVIEKDSDKPPRKLGLLTVGAEYADEIEKHMRISWSYSGFTVSLQKEIIPAPEHGGELVVFSAIFTPGLIMHVR